MITKPIIKSYSQLLLLKKKKFSQSTIYNSFPLKKHLVSINKIHFNFKKLFEIKKHLKKFILIKKIWGGGGKRILGKRYIKNVFNVLMNDNNSNNNNS